jgi:hypothetical protein
MKTKRRGVRRFVALATVTAMLAGGAAFADEVVNDVPPDVETNIKTARVTEGASLAVNYAIEDTGPAQCDANTAGVSVVIVVPAGVTASPSSLSWSQADCTAEAERSVTFTGAAAGTYGITHVITWTPLPGSSRTMENSADFTLIVEPAGVVPTLDPVVTPAAPDGEAGWYVSDVSIDWGIAGDPFPTIVDGCRTGPFTEDGEYSETCTVENSFGSASETVNFKLDKTPPTVEFVGGPEDGASYVFGAVPSAPTCDAFDALSGLDGACSVTGYGTTVGPHTLTATATDMAGNIGTVTRTYSVTAWDLFGFKSPVRMEAENVMKGGRTVPLKFEVFAGDTEITSTADVQSFRVFKIACGTTEVLSDNAITDSETTTGKTQFRYDMDEGQFIHNWQTPKVSTTTCYRVEMETRDGSSIEAFFKLTR